LGPTTTRFRLPSGPGAKRESEEREEEEEKAEEGTEEESEEEDFFEGAESCCALEVAANKQVAARANEAETAPHTPPAGPPVAFEVDARP
jgi:hypothetical protein